MLCKELEGFWFPLVWVCLTSLTIPFIPICSVDSFSWYVLPLLRIKFWVTREICNISKDQLHRQFRISRDALIFLLVCFLLAWSIQIVKVPFYHTSSNGLKTITRRNIFLWVQACPLKKKQSAQVPSCHSYQEGSIQKGVHGLNFKAKRTQWCSTFIVYEGNISYTRAYLSLLLPKNEPTMYMRNWHQLLCFLFKLYDTYIYVVDNHVKIIFEHMA